LPEQNDSDAAAIDLSRRQRSALVATVPERAGDGGRRAVPRCRQETRRSGTPNTGACGLTIARDRPIRPFLSPART
jgi:hypothetical protein